MDLEPETTKKIKIDDSRSTEDNEKKKLGEDELILIFSNTWISTQDLFNLRLVSKIWRDAATTILLQRDACVVELYEDSNQDPPCFYRKRVKKTHKNKLSQLTELISTSQKFPSTNFRIQTSLVTFTPYTHFQDLMHFFKLYGDRIKTLQPLSLITRQCLQDILFTHTPALEHLDLTEARIRVEKENSKVNALEWTSKTLPFKSLTIGDFFLDYCEYPDNRYEEREFHSKNAAGREVVHLLLSSPSKLCSIENVTLQTLQMVLTEGKGHLIRSFKYTFYDSNMDQASDGIMKKYTALNPTLSKATLDLEFRYPLPASFINSVDRFIQSFKDTVQNLALIFSYNENYFPWCKLLSIPPMKKLKLLTLKMNEITRRYYVCECGGRSKCNVCNPDYEANMDLRKIFFQFEDGISAENYFPSLIEVTLMWRQTSHFKVVNLMSFFLFNSDTNGPSVNWNCLPKVDILSITGRSIKSGATLGGTCQIPTETLLFPEVFPNIRILKFRCGEVDNLSDALWTSFPNVEFMEIYGIRSSSVCGTGLRMSHFSDNIFTGFSDRISENLPGTAAGLPCERNDDFEKMKFGPRRPSIFDLRHLRQLKLKFEGKWSTQFASSVTGINAFSKMPNTKFIISYDPESVLGWSEDRAYFSDSNEDDDDEIAEYEKLIFGAIKPYVHIVYEKQNNDSWLDF